MRIKQGILGGGIKIKSIAVIGISFGDEGKGRVVSYLCSLSDNPLVVRFSGGQQAGHHVVINDSLDHVFANFGSGTLQGIDTWWSKFCTIDPVGICNEADILKTKIDKMPNLYIDGRCPVTTPHEKRVNIEYDTTNNHGTCGVGFGQTHQREQDRYSLTFEDLFSRQILDIKLNLLDEYYGDEMQHSDMEDFLNACSEITMSPYIKQGPPVVHGDIIFEGSQGLLLDQDIGFFPHVTRSYTGSKNILSLGYTPNVVLVTRAYQTRHGNGPMVGEDIPNRIKNNPHEKNDSDGIQGKFRIAPLSLDLLKYGICKDPYINNKKDKILVVTCIDLVQESFDLITHGSIRSYPNEKMFIDAIRSFLGIDTVYVSKSPVSTEIYRV